MKTKYPQKHVKPSNVVNALNFIALFLLGANFSLFAIIQNARIYVLIITIIVVLVATADSIERLTNKR